MKNKYLIIFLLSFGAFGISLEEASPKPATSPATSIVLFGATGDLAAKKLIPALARLDAQGQLGEKTSVIAIGRRDYIQEQFQNLIHKTVLVNDEADWNRFKNKLIYLSADFEKDEGYELLRALTEKTNRLFYLSTQPSSFPTIIQKLSEHDLIFGTDSPVWSRVAIEKPFGRDLESAHALQNLLSEHLEENQIYRVDHFLGKEGIQKLLSFRFGDSLFEPVWNSRSIEQVQITISEEVGIGTRAHFWEETGLLRDLFQNHLMQILSIVSMQPPSTLNAEAIHGAKIQLLEAIRPVAASVFGQYAPGEIKGAPVPGYRQEKDVPADSNVETFAAAKIFIDNDRWKGTPFYLRAGKRLPFKTTEIAVQFKGKENEKGHTLFIRIQPDPAIYLRKAASDTLVRLDQPASKPETEAYEKLFAACLKGDSTLFVQADEQIASWRLWTPLLKNLPDSSPYKAGTWGPQSAEDLTTWELLENL